MKLFIRSTILVAKIEVTSTIVGVNMARRTDRLVHKRKLTPLKAKPLLKE